MTAPQDREMDTPTVERCIHRLQALAAQRYADGNWQNAQGVSDSIGRLLDILSQPAPAATERETVRDLRKQLDSANYDKENLERLVQCLRAEAVASKPAAPEQPGSDEELARELARELANAYDNTPVDVPYMKGWLRVLAKARELFAVDPPENHFRRHIDALLAERNALAQENAGLKRERDWIESARKSVATGLQKKRAECDRLRAERDSLTLSLRSLRTAERDALGQLLKAQSRLARIADLARGDGREG